jgi:hypothetical protein
LPLAKDLDGFSLINESLVRDLATGVFLAEQRNAVLVGGTGTGKSHLAIAIARGVSAAVQEVASTSSSTSSIVSKTRPAPADRAGWQITSPVWTSSSSTNSAICPSPRPAASFSFI